MNDQNLLSKTDYLIIGFFFIILFSFYYDFYLKFHFFSLSNDYLFHYYRAINKCGDLGYYLNCNTYPVGYTVLSYFFSFSQPIFFIFNLLFLCWLIPLTLKRIVNNNWILPLYFSCSFLFNTLYAGIFPQMLILELFLCYLLFRNSQYRYIFLGIALFTHNFGAIFMFLVWGIDTILKIFKDFKYPELNFSLIAFPVLKQVALGERLIESFFKPMPFIFVWIGLKKLIKEKMYFLLAILIITVISAFFDVRTLLFSEIILIIPASMYLSESKKFFKILAIILILLYFFFNLLFWVNSSLSLFLGKPFI